MSLTLPLLVHILPIPLLNEKSKEWMAVMYYLVAILGMSTGLILGCMIIAVLVFEDRAKGKLQSLVKKLNML